VQNSLHVAVTQIPQLDRQGRGDGSRELFILEALTDLLGSEDATVVNRACLGLLNLAELKSADVAKYFVSSKRFVTTLVCACVCV
jgi:hypothetical protein